MEESVIGYEREVEMLEALRQQAAKHTERWPERLVLLPVDPESYPGQVGYHAEGEPKPSTELNAIAATVTPRPDDYPEMSRQLAAFDAKHSLASQIHQLLDKENNLIVATNHADLIDIALAQAAIYDLISRESTGNVRTGIMISKLVSLIAARIKIGADYLEIPAVSGLGWLCHDTYLSFPRSDSLQRSGFAAHYSEEINTHNTKLRESVTARLERGRFLLAVAPSGTTDSEDEAGGLRMGRVGNGTEKLLLQKNSYTLPMAIWLGEKVVLRPSAREPRRLTDTSQVHTMMLGLAKKMRQITGLVYYPTLGESNSS